MAHPKVTVVIPVRDEAERLTGCLDAVAAQDFAPDDVEVLVVDGGSTDDTVEVGRRLLDRGPWIRAKVLHCSAGDRSSNLNCGLAEASAGVVVRVDARSRIPRDYLSRCLELLERHPDAAVVGGRQQAVAAGDGPVGIGVARALNNRWGTGLARYRRSGTSGISETVYLGAYRTSQLRQVGGWRTDLAVNEDFDLNRRLLCFGTVWFDAEMNVDYLPRSSATALLGQYWAFGLGKARYWRLSGERPRPRQVVLLAAPLVGTALLAGVLAISGPAALGKVVLAGLALSLGIEMAGADEPRGGLWAHVVAAAALGGIAGAWLSGVAAGALRPVPRSEVTHSLAERVA